MKPMPANNVAEGLKLPASLIGHLYDSGILRDVCGSRRHSGTKNITLILNKGMRVLCTSLGKQKWSLEGSALL